MLLFLLLPTTMEKLEKKRRGDRDEPNG